MKIVKEVRQTNSILKERKKIEDLHLHSSKNMLKKNKRKRKIRNSRKKEEKKREREEKEEEEVKIASKR